MSRGSGQLPPGRRKAGGPDAATGRADRPGPASGSAAAAIPRSRLRDAADRAGAAAAEWAPTVSRVLLGLVLAWFGYHELVRPGLWTGYVPVLSPGSSVSVILVLAHGWVLMVLAVALVAGIVPRAAAAVAAVALTEIVISLAVSGGLSDLVLRDVGVLGVAVALTGTARQRLVLR